MDRYTAEISKAAAAVTAYRFGRTGWGVAQAAIDAAAAELGLPAWNVKALASGQSRAETPSPVRTAINVRPRTRRPL